MRAEVHHHPLVAATQHPRVGEGRHAGPNLDGDSAGVVEHAVLITPAVGVPHPVRKRAVDQRGPEEGEDHAGDDAPPLGDGADCQGGGDGAKHHLVEGEQQRGDERRPDRRRGPDVDEAKVLEVADEAVIGRLTKGKRVSPEVPLEYDDAKGHHNDPEHGEG